MRPLLLALIASVMLFATPRLAAQVIDDFETEGAATMGGQWRLFTDQVMGGVSVGQAIYVRVGSDRGLRLSGQVSTANNGGFIQAALNFQGLRDASAFKGIELRVRGDGKVYHLHLRDRSTRLPWQVYTASYDTTGRVQTVRIPFTSFARYAGRGQGTLNPSALRQIGLVAGYADIEADLTVLDLRFY